MSAHKHPGRPGRPIGRGTRGRQPGGKAQNFNGTHGNLLN